MKNNYYPNFTTTSELISLTETRQNCLNVFDHFMGLVLKGLSNKQSPAKSCPENSPKF